LYPKILSIANWELALQFITSRANLINTEELPNVRRKIQMPSLTGQTREHLFHRKRKSSGILTANKMLPAAHK
jgi:hypothetical protein